MLVQNKPNARIFEFIIKNFQGVEVLEYEFDDYKPCILYGENGSGKSDTINALYMALKGRKQSDLPTKIDNPVGPFSTDKIKKATVDIGIEGDQEVLELEGDSLSKLYVHFSVTEKGTVSLTVTDDNTGKNYTTPREKIKKLLGMFLDPVELVNTLNEPSGDQKLAEKLAAMVGIDFAPFVKLEEQLFQQFQDENKELKRLQAEFDALDKPQPNWATTYVDPASISDQQQKLNALKSRNEQRVRNIIEPYKELTTAETAEKEINSEIDGMKIDKAELEKQIEEKRTRLENNKADLEKFKEENQPEEWLGTQNIEEKIKQLTEELTLFRTHERKEREKKEIIEEKSKSIEIEEERLSSDRNQLKTKNDLIDKKVAEKLTKQALIDSISSKIERAHTDNIMESWTGEKDPNGILF
ncbi:MAG: AAA family ATPase, partial [Candidatus Zixiibacteriota bacterium]